MALSELTWPATLPQCPLVAGYSSGLGSNTIRTDFDAGPARMRRRSTAALEPRQVSYMLDDDQRQALKDFLTLAEGRSFWWPDEGATMRYARIKPDNWDSLFSRVGALWTVTLTFEVWPYVTNG